MRSTLMAALAATTFLLPVSGGAEGLADGLAGEMPHIMVMDPYARASTPTARSGAAFMQIMNHGEADRLIAVRSPAAKRVELHSHREDEDGVMRMTHVKEGFGVAADQVLSLTRGGKHVMLMGLSERFDQGAMIEMTLTFETAGEVVVKVPVDLERKADHDTVDHGTMDHDTVEHGAMDHATTNHGEMHKDDN